MKTLLALAIWVSLATAHADDLGETLELLSRRAQYPESPATPGGRPTTSEIRRAEQTVLEEKTRLEAMGITLMKSDLARYLEHVTQITIARASTGMDLSREWIDRFSVRAPQALIQNIGQNHAQWITERGSLRISPLYIQGIELGCLANRPNGANFLTVMQYLATRTLLQNLQEVRELQLNPSSATPVIPQRLRAKVRTLNLTFEEMQQIGSASSEHARRLTIAQEVEEIIEQLPAFFTESVAQQIAELVPPANVAELRALLLEVFGTAERERIRSTLQAEAMHGESTHDLGRLLTEAKVNTVMSTLTRLSMSQDSRLRSRGLSFTSEQRARILQILSVREAQYQQEIPATLLTRLSESIQNRNEQESRETRRRQFINQMILAARATSTQILRAEMGRTLDIGAAIRTLVPEILELEPLPELMDWVVELGSAPSYVEARQKYAERMMRITSSDVVQWGLVIPDRIQHYLGTHGYDFDPRLTQGLGREQAGRMRDRMRARRVKRIRDYMQVGEWLGFHRGQWYGQHWLFPAEPQTVHQILRDDDRETKYFEQLDQVLTEKYPILTLKVWVRQPDNRMDNIRLADALAHLRDRSPDPWVEQALAQSEQKILESIEKVGNVRRIEELQSIITSSAMLREMTRSHPEFAVQARLAQERILSPSLLDQVINQHIGHYVDVAAGSLLLLHGSKWIASKVFGRSVPLLEMLTIASEPLMSGFMRSMALSLLARDAYMAWELNERGDALDEGADLVAASGVGGHLMTSGQLATLHEDYQLSKWHFFFSVSLDSLVFYMEGRRALQEAGLLGSLREPLSQAELTLLDRLSQIAANDNGRAL